jgi:hypothetical protein
MKKLSEFIERHEIDRPMFFTLLALCVLIFIFVIYQLFTVFGWWAFSPIVVSIICIVASILKAKPKEEPAGKKWVAIAPKKGKIAPYLTNGKAYDVLWIGGENENYGREFRFLSDIGAISTSNELNSLHLNGLNWTLKEVNISKNEHKDTKN